MGSGVFLLVMLAVTLIDLWQDPRKLRVGIEFLLCAIFAFNFVLYSFALTSAGRRLVVDVPVSAWMVLAVMLLTVLGVIVLGLFLIGNGVTMLKAEGVALSHALSLILGFLIVGYVALGVGCAIYEQQIVVLFLLALVFPLGWLGFGLLSFVIYSWMYRQIMTRWGRQASAIVVLGAGVPDGQVRPLLASRIRTAIQRFSFELRRGNTPAFVVSGGQGADEPISEAQAMERWAYDNGMEGRIILREDRSTTTEENLRFSHALLAEKGQGAYLAVVTSSYHAFRAATLMRRLGIPGYALGAPTASYFVPSALLREYVALIHDNLKLNLVVLGLLSVPLMLMVLLWISNG